MKQNGVKQAESKIKIKVEYYLARLSTNLHESEGSSKGLEPVNWHKVQ